MNADVGPAIAVWYGEEQHFGHLGNPQPRINILGSVSNPSGLEALAYSLNGAPSRPLSMGVDLRRLAHPGDFNIEIERSDLRPGENVVEIAGKRIAGGTISETVRVHYTPGRTCLLPYKIEWSRVDHIGQVAEVMDGRWELTADGVRTLDPYYDRVIMIGDMSWTDYEVLTSVVFHQMFADEIVPSGPPFSNHGHASLLLRWQGHGDDGKQPRVQWRPGTGALAMWRANANEEGNEWIWHGGPSGFIGKEENKRVVEIGRRYLLRARVETLPGPKTRYSIRSWDARDPEPDVWDAVGIDDEHDVQSGSLLFVVHHSDVTFGDVEVRPLR